MSKTIYYNSILINIILIFRNTWFPGAKLIQGPAELIAIDFLFFLSLMLYLNVDGVMTNSIRLNSFDFLALSAILFLTVYSTLSYNSQEITNVYRLSRFIGYFAVLGQFFVFLPGFFLKYPDYFLKYLKFISLFGFFSALIGMLMYILNINPIEKYSSQLVSILVHPNNTSVIFTISVITTLYLYLTQKKNISNLKAYYYLFSILIQLMAQLLTLTRAGLIGTFLGLAIFGIVVLKKKVIYVYPIASILLPFLVLGFVKSKGFSSFISRFYLLIPAYHMITDSTISMLWGYGFTRTLSSYQAYRIQYNVLEENIEDPHNSVVMLILMVGIIIALLIMVFISKLIGKGIIQTIRKKDQNTKMLLGFMFSFVISIIAHCLFDSSLARLEYITMGFFLPILGILWKLTDKRNDLDGFVKKLKFSNAL